MKYKVRFKAEIMGSRSENPSLITAVASTKRAASAVHHSQGGASRRLSKSRRGCKECKARKVKCDDTYPVCLICQRRGSICRPAAPPPMQWQVETPMILLRTPTEPWTGAIKPDEGLLHYWLDSSCRMLSLTPEDNPFSYPLVEHLLYTPSLVHAVQSVSAGQMVFYHQPSLQKCLSERGLALETLQNELHEPEKIKPASLLTVFLLGISASWAEDQPYCYGKEHISGARVLLGRALADTRTRGDPLVKILLGWYLYWDMAVSLVASPDDSLSGIGVLDMCAAIETSQAAFHPMIGFSGKLYYLITCLNRHCRLVIQGHPRDLCIAAEYKRQLLAWAPRHEDKTLVDASVAFRNHGLIMLHEVYGCPNRGPGQCEADIDSDAARALAHETLKRLFETPLDAPCIHSHSIPLLTAGSQLRSDDTSMRVQVVDRFKALFSINRLMVNLWAIQLLEELWSLRDSGSSITWLELLLSKNWTLNFA